jgi:hypothetical protein
MPSTVAELCQNLGIDSQELSRRSGVEHTRVIAILMRRWTPSPREREQISAVFGVAKDDVVWGHATPVQHIYGHGPG